MYPISRCELFLGTLLVLLITDQDEFKIVVVEAIQTLCLKFPQKHRTLVNFLSNILREEGGFSFKKAIVDTIFCIIKNIPDAKDSGLTHLSEFIEDCEFTYLSSQILHLLGNEGPNTSDPSKYIRYIYNRVVLENAAIRASAISALSKFGAECPLLRSRVLTLLYRCLHDSDDEVRDRATLCVQSLEKIEAHKPERSKSHAVTDYALLDLENDLHSYVSGSLNSPYIVQNVRFSSQLNSTDGGGYKSFSKTAFNSLSENLSVPIDHSILVSNPLFSPYGIVFKVCFYFILYLHISNSSIFKSSKPKNLTEAETEYKVNKILFYFI